MSMEIIQKWELWVARHEFKRIKSVCIGKSLGYSKIQFIAHLAIYIYPHPYLSPITTLKRPHDVCIGTLNIC